MIKAAQEAKYPLFTGYLLALPCPIMVMWAINRYHLHPQRHYILTSVLASVLAASARYTAMAIPSFQEFQWLHIQPGWAFEPDYRTAIKTAGARFERWEPLWKLLMVKGFTDYEVGLLIGLKDEYENGVGRKG